MARAVRAGAPCRRAGGGVGYPLRYMARPLQTVHHPPPCLVGGIWHGEEGRSTHALGMRGGGHPRHACRAAAHPLCVRNPVFLKQTGV